MIGTRHVGNWLLGLAGLAIVIAVWALVGWKLVHPVPITVPSARMQPGAIVWDNRVFSSRTGLASWLASHGATYQEWARRHRTDAAIVEHVPSGPLTPPRGHQAADASQRSRVRQTGRARPPAASVGRNARAAGTTSGTTFSLSWVPYALLVLGAVGMLAAIVPAALVQLPGGDWFSATRRTYVFALGFSISIGVLIAGFHA